jgi:hypothetical protein
MAAIRRGAHRVVSVAVLLASTLYAQSDWRLTPHV